MASEAAIPQARYAYPKFKVFIFGVDVSADVTDINVVMSDGSAPNTCQVTLLSDDDKYLVNSTDIAALNNIKQVKIPWLAGSKVDNNFLNSLNKEAATKVFDSTGDSGSYTSANVEKSIRNQVKMNILRTKAKYSQDISKQDRSDPVSGPADVAFNDYYGAKVFSYPIKDGTSIFHSMDPIRVFMRDPFDPTRWYHHFAGFVSDSVERQTANGVKTLTVSAEDPTKLFRYTRIFVNPGIVDAKVVIQENDIKVSSFYSQFLKGLDLPEIYFTLMFGPDKVGYEKFMQKSASASGDSPLRTRFRGIGHFAFDLSGIYSFGPDGQFSVNNDLTRQTKNPEPDTDLYRLKKEITLKNLHQWQALIDHEVQPSDMWSMATELDRQRYLGGSSPLSQSAEDVSTFNYVKSAAARAMVEERLPSAVSLGPDGLLDVEKVVDYIGTHPDQYRIDGGRLMMLLPKSLGKNNRSVLISDIISSYPLNSEWHSAGEIMYDIIENLQFALYCSPKGDIVVEFPMYDFDPDDFGLERLPFDKLFGNAADYGGVIPDQLIPSRPRGPFGQNFVVTDMDCMNIESAVVDSKVHTIATCANQIIPDWPGIGNTAILGKLQVVPLPDLIPMYGVRQAPVALRGYIGTPEGAKLLATITLARLNCDAHTLSVSANPNIKAWINRPMYIERRNLLSTVKQVSHGLMWGENGDMSTSLDLYATRTWDGTVDENGVPNYTSVGGMASNPLDYSVLMKVRDKPVNQTVNDTGPKQLEARPWIIPII